MKNASSFPIVGIGASAGGLEALMELLLHLETDTGMAFVIIQHLAPYHNSLLSVILAKKTSMIVREAQHNILMEPDCCYVIPPNKDMTLVDGHISLSPRQNNLVHMPIDKFFTSMAEVHGENIIGIVLSGSAHDGTLGLRAIKQANGLTIAQDDSAKFQGMPHSAIAENVVDLVLSPKEIALALASIGARIREVTETKKSTGQQFSSEDLHELFLHIKTGYLG